MPQMSFDLEDGQSPVVFHLTPEDAARFQDFMAECNGYLKRAERLENLLAAERERAEALASHVERISKRIPSGTITRSNDVLRNIISDMRHAPETSLAQRDARGAAEVLRNVAAEYDDKQSPAHFLVMHDLIKRADEIEAGGDQ